VTHSAVTITDQNLKALLIAILQMFLYVKKLVIAEGLGVPIKFLQLRHMNVC